MWQRKESPTRKLVKLFMMQGARFFFSKMKLAKVNMPSTFLEFGKARIEFVLEKKYYDGQRPKRNDKFAIAITF